MADYSEELRRKMWNRLRTVSGKDKDSFRLDAAGALIEWSKYGEYSSNGWQMDHACPKKILSEHGVKEGDMDAEVDLRPFNTANNEKKGDEFPKYIRAVFYNDKTDKNEKDGTTSYIVNRQVQKSVMKHFGLPITLFGDGHKKTANDINNYLDSK